MSKTDVKHASGTVYKTKMPMAVLFFIDSKLLSLTKMKVQKGSQKHTPVATKHRSHKK